MKKNIFFTIAILTIFFSTTLFGGTKKFDREMQPVLHEYLKIYHSLLKNSTKGIKKAAINIKKYATKVNSNDVSGKHKKHYKNISKNLQKSANLIIKAKNIKEIREAFKSLSKPISMWVSMSKPKNMKVAYCPMAKASWIQKEEKINNPYKLKMPHCGSFVGGEMSKKE